MASRKPEFRLSMPTRCQADAFGQRSQNAMSSPRSPRFHEDFDAPFSEALLNASRTTLATDVSDSYPSSNSRHSLDADNKRQPTAAASRKSRPRSPTPPQTRHGTWHASESSRRSSVNDRIRDWARKSFLFARKGPEQADDADFSRSRPRESTTPASGASAPASDNVATRTRSGPD
ncbi:hypothetical protein CDD83_9855 [Cordyceps sp. RAO-2017]|nr:hypothetical protein CDD83_9855 [Cordyceps sp. RAO-2017]